MSVSVCPVDVVDAPMETVWAFLSQPANYDLWWDAQTRAIVPEGPAHPGQKIYARASGLKITVTVRGSDDSGHRLHLTTKFPFGITVENHIACTPLENGSCQVSFG